MPGDGIRLGGAFYEISADSAPLIKAVDQARQRSEASLKAIAAATGLPEKAVRQYAATLIRETQQANAALERNAAAAERAAQRQAAAFKQAGDGLSGLAKGAIGFTVAAAGIATGAAAVHQALSKIAEETQKATQAQFALQAAFGASTQRLTEFSKAQGASIGRTPAEIQQAILLTATLAKNYGFTDAQLQELIKRTADYAALTGRDFLPAVQDVVSAMRGEGDAAERLGLALQKDALKSLANLTAEQRKNFDSLSVLEQSQIAYAEFLRQTSGAQGVAAQRTKEQAGAFQNLDTATKNLAATIGEKLAPSAALGASQLATLTNSVNTFIKAADPAALADFAAVVARIAGGDIFGGIADAVARRTARELRPPSSLPADSRDADSGPHEGADVAEAARRRKADELLASEQERRRRKAELEAADKANDATAESAIRAIDRERKEKERWYDEERQRIEARRTYQLEDIEARRDAAIKGLEDEKQAAKDAIDAQIAEQERLKDARIAQAEAAAEAAKRAVEAEKDRLDRVREAEDRARDDARRLEDRDTEDARRVEDRVREQAQEREVKRLEDLRDARIAAIEAEIEAADRASEKRLRALDREADRARATSDAALRRLERRGEKEDEQHRKRMQALDDEQDAQLGILDAQLKALDAQEKSADAAERLAGIQKRLSDAQQAATAARGTGTADEIAAARGDLTTALRVGNEVSIANARERLVQLAGKGNEAIKKADEDLAEAQRDLAKEGVESARDAERDKIRAAQDAVKARIEAEKREEDDADRRRKASLERDQEAERDRLKARLDRLESQKKAAQDADAEEKRLLRSGLDEERQASQELIQQARDRAQAEGEILQDRRRDEDRFRDDQRQAQDRFRADERSAQDADLARQLAAIGVALETERRETEAHFNGPNGTITQLKKASEDTEREYSRRLAAARIAFEEERKAAERVYTNPEGNGLLDLLAKARQDESDKLEASKQQWQDWQKSVSESIKAALDNLDDFIKRGADADSAVSSGIRAAASGKSQGDAVDVEGWLRAAISEAGVGEDWLKGLTKLVAKESSGDPRAINPEKVGNENATGLLQTLPSTFKANKKAGFDDIFDPVANAIASIRYIKRTYGHVDNIPGLYQGKFKGYAAGGWVSEPSYLVSARSGRPWGTIAERGPEYVTPSAGMIDRRPMLGPGPRSDRAGMGGFMAAAHPGGAGASTYMEGDIHVSGVGLGEVAREIERQQKRQRILRGSRVGVR